MALKPTQPRSDDRVGGSEFALDYICIVQLERWGAGKAGAGRGGGGRGGVPGLIRMTKHERHVQGFD